MEFKEFWESITPEQRIAMYIAIQWQFTPQSQSLDRGLEQGEWMFDVSNLIKVSSAEVNECNQIVKSDIDEILSRKPDATISEILVGIKGKRVFREPQGAPPGFRFDYPDWLR